MSDSIEAYLRIFYDFVDQVDVTGRNNPRYQDHVKSRYGTLFQDAMNDYCEGQSNHDAIFVTRQVQSPLCAQSATVKGRQSKTKT